MKSIEITDLTKTFGNFLAVSRVTFSVDESEVFGFLGPNGAGKTTTIRMLCGILKPTSGKGSVGGYDIITENEKIKKQIGYMSQKFSLYRDLTVEENIDFFAMIYNMPKRLSEERKKWALDIARLIDFRKRLARELPAGYKQRLALVCALIHGPRIIFLDEPTAGVDPVSRREFWDLIYRLKSEEKTTIFVTTHYLDEAEHCERIALIQKGTIAAIGSPSELKESVKDAVYVVKGAPFFAVKEALEREIGSSNVVPFGVAFHIFVQDKSRLGDIKNMLGRSKVKIVQFTEIVPSLEDVFISLVGK